MSELKIERTGLNYKVTASSGNVYKMKNLSIKFPYYAIQGEVPNKCELYIGHSLKEALAFIRENESNGTYKPLKAHFDEPIYIHHFSKKDGYSAKPVDMNEVLIRVPTLLQLYGDFVFSYGNKDDFEEAKQVLQEHMDSSVKQVILHKIEEYTKNLNDYESKISAMYDSTYDFSECDKEVEDDNYDR